MDPSERLALNAAGRVSKEARELAVEIAVEGALVRELADEVEGLMERRGLRPAFPTCVSINSVAAHYSPTHDDQLRLRRGDVVKLDLGAHSDGWIGDTAVTVEIGDDKWTELIRASDIALRAAIAGVKPGVETSYLGSLIAKNVQNLGFRPIRNLTGHTITKYRLHAGKSVPNVARGHDTLELNEVLAIEPFSTSGAGEVDGHRPGNIYRVIRSKPMKDGRLEAFRKQLEVSFKSLPFAERWAFKIDQRAPLLLAELTHRGALMAYPQLLDVHHGIVAQTEHTMIVTPNGAQVTTL